MLFFLSWCSGSVFLFKPALAGKSYYYITVLFPKKTLTSASCLATSAHISYSMDFHAYVWTWLFIMRTFESTKMHMKGFFCLHKSVWITQPKELTHSAQNKSACSDKNKSYLATTLDIDKKAGLQRGWGATLIMGASDGLIRSYPRHENVSSPQGMLFRACTHEQSTHVITCY